MDGRQKISDQANCKGQLTLTVRGERRLRRIIRSQRSQTLAQTTTQLNDGASRTFSKRTVQRSLYRMDFGTVENTIAQCSPSGCTSWMDKRTQRLECR
ncbi:HTH_Tnp_Tc3_2 domain-containing protein [Trichonephila clavipes]|nr:HTH_Tnp_Tc3_2 domain-containing protein [Trichonephila clavipes]